MMRKRPLARSGRSSRGNYDEQPHLLARQRHEPKLVVEGLGFIVKRINDN
jgi:hypothetical protein